METLFNSFIVLFIVVDPLGIASIFASLTHGGTDRYRRQMAVKGTVLATAIMLTFLFIGDLLLKALGIGLPAFRIAGGALLFLLAIDMVFARQSGLRSTTSREQQEAEHKDDISVFPLAFPLISGPGTLTTILLMASHTHDMAMVVSNVVIMFLVLALTLLTLLSASTIMKWMGETGANVVSRLFGLILAALAVQYMLDGLRAGLAGI